MIVRIYGYYSGDQLFEFREVLFPDRHVFRQRQINGCALPARNIERLAVVLAGFSSASAGAGGFVGNEKFMGGAEVVVLIRSKHALDQRSGQGQVDEQVRIAFRRRYRPGPRRPGPVEKRHVVFCSCRQGNALIFSHFGKKGRMSGL